MVEPLYVLDDCVTLSLPYSQVTQLTGLTNLQSVMVWSDFSYDVADMINGFGQQGLGAHVNAVAAAVNHLALNGNAGAAAVAPGMNLIQAHAHAHAHAQAHAQAQVNALGPAVHILQAAFEPVQPMPAPIQAGVGLAAVLQNLALGGHLGPIVGAHLGQVVGAGAPPVPPLAGAGQGHGAVAAGGGGAAEDDMVHQLQLSHQVGVPCRGVCIFRVHMLFA